MMKRIAGVVVAVWVLISQGVQGEVTMSRMFGSGMILQRELPVPIYGRAEPGERVTVTFAGQEKSATAGDDGKWQVVLEPLKTSNEGQTLTVKGNNEKSFKRVLVGEVWLCAGQSNMAGRFGEKHSLEDEYLKMDLKRMRFCGKGKKGWNGIDERSAKSLSRVAFYFGVNLYKELDVPIGLITRHNGGTPMQAWMSEDDAEMARKALNIPEGWREEPKKIRNPGFQYNDKLKEVIPYGILGAIWYQGERNAKSNTAWEYDRLTVRFIDSWRKDWGNAPGWKRASSRSTTCRSQQTCICAIMSFPGFATVSVVPWASPKTPVWRSVGKWAPGFIRQTKAL